MYFKPHLWTEEVHEHWSAALVEALTKKEELFFDYLHNEEVDVEVDEVVNILFVQLHIVPIFYKVLFQALSSCHVGDSES